MTLSELSRLSQAEFVKTLASIYEHSPWVAEHAWQHRPFNSLETLRQAMAEAVANAGDEKQLALLRAHPELAGKEASAGTLTNESRQEQRGAGLDQCNAAELQTLQHLNKTYRERFDFPFIIAVKGLSRQQIIEQMQQRVHNDPITEWKNSLAQVHQIARHRLEQLLQA